MPDRKEDACIYVERLSLKVRAVLKEAAHERRDDAMLELLEEGRGLVPRRWVDDVWGILQRLHSSGQGAS